MRRNPWKTNFAVFLFLCCLVIGLLAFAHAFAPGNTRACFVFPVWWRWVAWIGCTMAAHENLAAGLIGGGGALFAAWVAANGIVQQMRLTQLAREEDRIEREGPGARDSIAFIWAIDDELRQAGGEPGPMWEVVGRFAGNTLVETNRLIAEKLPLVADDFRRPIAVTLYDLSEAVKGWHAEVTKSAPNPSKVQLLSNRVDLHVTRLRTIEKQLSEKIKSGDDRAPRLRAEIEEFFRQ